MLATTCPNSMRSRRLAPPGKRVSAWPNSRPASCRVSRKLASGFFRSSPAPHARRVAAQAADERPACTIFSYQTASGYTVGPNSEVTAFDSFVAFSKGYAGKFWAFGDPVFGAGGDAMVDNAIAASGYSAADQAKLQRIASAGKAAGNIGAMAIQIASLGMASKFAPGFEVKSDRPTYLYQMVGADGAHLKYGITVDPAGRYSPAELAGAQLRILAEGPRAQMLYLERGPHETMPIGPREGQGSYIQIQVDRGYVPPAQYPIWGPTK